MRHHHALAALAIFCVVMGRGEAPAEAGTVVHRAKRDDISRATAGDPQMLAAFTRAQRTLDGFIEALDSNIAGTGGFSVKIPVVDHDKTEYFWINGLSHVGGMFSGTVENRPEMVQNITFGQQISFQKSQIRDWSYTRDGRMLGSFTTCVLLSRQDPAEAQELEAQIGLTCEEGM